MKKSKRTREIQKRFKVFCEGSTEACYFSSLKKDKKLSLVLKPIDMRGGGYSSFLSKIKVDGNANCIAKFIVIDGDRAAHISSEKENLKCIFEYCNNQNKKGIPHILIINCPDFEYVACLHSSKYQEQDIYRFIVDNFGYKDISKFKADENIYTLLNSGDNHYSIMLSKIKKNNAVVENKIKVNKSDYSVDVKSIAEFEKLSRKGTNIHDFFEVLKLLEII